MEALYLNTDESVFGASLTPQQLANQPEGWMGIVARGPIGQIPRASRTHVAVFLRVPRTQEGHQRVLISYEPQDGMHGSFYEYYYEHAKTSPYVNLELLLRNKKHSWFVTKSGGDVSAAWDFSFAAANYVASAFELDGFKVGEQTVKALEALQAQVTQELLTRGLPPHATENS